VSANDGVLANGDYTIEGLVTLAASVSYVADPTQTGFVGTITNFYGIGSEQSYRWDPDKAAAIAMAESGGDPTAHNPSGATGLWQIMPSNWGGRTMAEMENPLTNARVALSVYESQGWGAWTTYRTGAYLPFLAEAKASNAGKSVGDVQSINSAGQSSLGASQQVGDWLRSLGITLNWKEIGLLFLGGVALIMGMYILVKGK
jgi:hypothetical protein